MDNELVAWIVIGILFGTMVVAIFLSFLSPPIDNLAVGTSINPGCNFDTLFCKIYEENSFYRCSYEFANPPQSIKVVEYGKLDSNCTDVSNEFPIVGKPLCGYQEANAWFIQFKENYQGNFTLKMECQ